MASGIFKATVILLLASFAVPVAMADGADTVDYLRDVKPVFIKHCSSCHGGLKQRGGLRLDTAAAMKTGGDSGPAIVPGKAQESLLAEVLTGSADFQMPPEDEGTPPSSTDVAKIVQWIDAGAIGPAEEKPQSDPATYWSFQPPAPPPIPDLAGNPWIRSPIDAFVAAEHQRLGLAPTPPAAPEVWLRRVYLDLVGVPPSRAALVAFLADPSEAAYENVVDELLSRPQYGERWGRHWMDVWRYSDWYGRRPSNEIRYSQRHIWRWRDWIVQSLNNDKGYDRMLVEMLAGDEVAPTDRGALAATGFLGRNWYKFDKDTWLFETVEQTNRGFLAVTMRCARCHDHKYDPISQRDYYQFRAFFEPHSLRIDPVAGARTEVDNGKDKVPTDGLARAYDQDLAAPTYLFQRGDGRNPDKDHPLSPAVPAALRGDAVSITTVKLPPDAYLPQLSTAAVAGLESSSQAAIDTAQQHLLKKQNELAAARKQLAQAEQARKEQARNQQAPNQQAEQTPDGPAQPPFVREEFDQPLDTSKWKVVSGQWKVKDGKLIQSQVTSFATLVSLEDHPRDFVARVRYRKLQPGMYRSVGFSFDYADGGKASQDVYTSKTDGKPLGGVQAFHRLGGRQIYPRDGITTGKIEVGQWLDLEFRVRQSQLTIHLNGELRLEYALPVPRQPGKFAVWVHTGSAEFERLEVQPLVPDLNDLKAAVDLAEHNVQLAEKQTQLAAAKRRFALQQVAAERVRLGLQTGETDLQALAVEAHRSERTVAAMEAEIAWLTAGRAQRVVDSKENQDKVAAAHAALITAREAVQNADNQYTRLPAKYPTTSSGRRLALARWLTGPRHPRTSRVAVNHIWLRHFGKALVPTVDNFGLSGQPPSNLALLDWLATSFEDSGWRMKPLHKQIVLSSTYRMASRGGAAAPQNQRQDPDNVFLWRMNSRRAEAEVVRDSLLAVAGELDATLGGADLDDKLGQTSRRRSLYFRTTPDNQVLMLTLFDQASPTECYRRRESVIPQQALALSNGALAIDLSRNLAGKLTAELGGSTEATADAPFIERAFQRVLTRAPTADELQDCHDFLQRTAQLFAPGAKLEPFPAAKQKVATAAAKDPRQRARENLVHVLFNHTEFVTIR